MLGVWGGSVDGVVGVVGCYWCDIVGLNWWGVVSWLGGWVGRGFCLCFILVLLLFVVVDGYVVVWSVVCLLVGWVDSFVGSCSLVVLDMCVGWWFLCFWW